MVLGYLPHNSRSKIIINSTWNSSSEWNLSHLPHNRRSIDWNGFDSLLGVWGVINVSTDRSLRTMTSSHNFAITLSEAAFVFMCSVPIPAYFYYGHLFGSIHFFCLILPSTYTFYMSIYFFVVFVYVTDNICVSIGGLSRNANAQAGRSWHPTNNQQYKMVP